jgi:hypothetical protein
MAQQIANLLTSSSMPKRLLISNGMSGKFHIDDVCDALAMLTGLGLIQGYDAEDASDNGHGYITIL